MSTAETRRLAYSPTDAFWEGFVQKYWEQQPAVVTYPAQEPLMTELEALQIFFGIGEKVRAGQQADIYFFIDNAQLAAEIGRFLPNAADSDLMSYKDRLTNQLGGRRFAVITNSVRQESRNHWRRIRSFSRGLLKLVGESVGKLGADIFLSNTLTTAFGIHLDAASNFSYIMSGRKRMLVWPHEVFADRSDQRCNGPNQNIFLDGLDYQAYRDRAIVLEGGPGELLYWPSSYWHVAESTGELAVVLNVPIYLHVATYRMAIAYYQRKLDFELKKRPPGRSV